MSRIAIPLTRAIAVALPIAVSFSASEAQQPSRGAIVAELDSIQGSILRGLREQSPTYCAVIGSAGIESLLDLRGELEKQLGHLNRQARAAER